MNDLKALRQAIAKVEIPTAMPDKLKNNKEIWDEMAACPYIDQAIQLLGFPKKDTPIPPTPPTPSHEYVDLELSVLWATCNIGANSPEGYGDYYAWGELTTKDDYSAKTYTYTDNPEVLPADHDTATQLWGDGWRMPTNDEIDELTNDCQWEWTTQNGVNGYLVTGGNGNSIFLPAAGSRDATNLYDAGSYGYYWTSSLSTNDPGDARYVYFGSGDVDGDDSGRYDGQSVRPVKSK